MRAGVNECLAEPLHGGRDRTPRSRASWRTAARRDRARSSRSSAPRAASARRRWPSTSRPRWRSAPAAGRCSSTCTWPTATRRSSSAPSRASRSSTRSRTCTGSTRRSSRAWSCRRRGGRRPAGLVRSRASARRSTLQRVRTLLEFAAQHYRYIVLDVPRSDAACSTRSSRRRASSSSPTRSWRRCAAPADGGGAAPALRQGARHGRRQPLRRAGRDRPRATSRRSSARRVAHTFPSDYRLALQALNKGRPLALDNHNKLAAGVQRACARSGRRRAASERPAPEASGLFGLLTGRA